MVDQEQTKALTIDEFTRLYDEAPFEIIHGKWIPMSPTKFRHSRVSKRVYDAFLRYTDRHDTGEVFFETVYILEDRPNGVEGSRVPDVMFIRKESMARYLADTTDAEDKPLILVPDLVVEVISPTDSYSDVAAKIEAYLEDGVSIIWVFDPQRKNVAVYQGGSREPLIHRAGDILSGGDVAPGFELAVSNIFAE